ncbi:MAG: hypothetical protein ABW139_20715 [Candidatus Thiodiazotropha sp. DIVDIV]
MPETQRTKLTGQVISIETGDVSHRDEWWVDIGLKLIDGNFVNVNYHFNRKSVRDNIVNSIEKGMTITVTARSEVNIDEKFDYSGIGGIQIQDLSKELDRYIRKKFRQSEDSYFSEQEVRLFSECWIAQEIELGSHLIPVKRRWRRSKNISTLWLEKLHQQRSTIGGDCSFLAS